MLYAGSLIPQAVLEHVTTDVECINSASLCLEEILALIQTAHQRQQNVARLHSGDTAIL